MFHSRGGASVFANRLCSADGKPKRLVGSLAPPISGNGKFIWSPSSRSQRSAPGSPAVRPGYFESRPSCRCRPNDTADPPTFFPRRPARGSLPVRPGTTIPSRPNKVRRFFFQGRLDANVPRRVFGVLIKAPAGTTEFIQRGLIKKLTLFPAANVGEQFRARHTETRIPPVLPVELDVNRRIGFPGQLQNPAQRREKDLIRVRLKIGEDNPDSDANAGPRHVWQCGFNFSQCFTPDQLGSPAIPTGRRRLVEQDKLMGRVFLRDQRPRRADETREEKRKPAQANDLHLQRSPTWTQIRPGHSTNVK